MRGLLPLVHVWPLRGLSGRQRAHGKGEVPRAQVQVKRHSWCGRCGPEATGERQRAHGALRISTVMHAPGRLNTYLHIYDHRWEVWEVWEKCIPMHAYI
jgi:hypothetical protein